jgi:oxygen-independent coproporphyrinogen-3 oxidase
MMTLRGLQAQGLVEVSETGIQITEAGSLFVPTVVTVFDRYLQADHVRARFSRII